MALHQLKYPYRKFILPVVKKLTFINPDFISAVAFFVALATGYCFYAGSSKPCLFLWLLLLVFLRMTLNTMDGVLAIERGDDKKVHGKMVNALPDRYADLFVLSGIALSPICNDFIGLLGLCTVVLVSYSGMLGKALGVSWQGHGPLDKVERLFWLMIIAVAQYIGYKNAAPTLEIGAYSLSYLEIGMLVFFVLGQITVIRRTLGIKKEVDEAPDMEW